MDEWLVEPQPRLGVVGLLVLLVMGSLVAPLSLDMYTPAVPGMAEYFSTTDEIVNLTLVGYYLFLAVGLLIFGPLSDKYGRKPVLVAGMAAYCASSVVCALSASIWMLVAARVVQALGSGAMSAVCTAVVKDAVREDMRERMLAIIQVMFVIGPVAAPIIGAGILAVTDWRGTFWTLALISAAELVMALLFRETLPVEKRLGVGVFATLGHLAVVARNPGFTAFLLITSAWELGYMGYVSVGSYIYIEYFGFPPVGYSLFFAVAALTCAIGPVAWLRISRFTTKRKFTTIAIIASLAIGVGEFVLGPAGAFVFCALFMAFAFFESAVRPYAVNVLLSQQENDTGSASALINFTRTFMGVIGMFAVVAPVFSDYISAVAWLMAGGMALALVGWVALLRSSAPLKGVKD
ncbi:MAG: MFS transporter [Eggerthellaceae bacterium]|nr:MFS transporter [Eggerthellaceae bacterium]MBQ9044196.1 MFS transporter [Eggerthellaceae bacterium]